MFRLVDHPADIAVELTAENRVSLYKTAIEALIVLLTTFDPYNETRLVMQDTSVPLHTIEVMGGGSDDEVRLVELLDDVIFNCQVRGWYPICVGEVQFKNDEVRVEINVIPQTVEHHIVRELKATTYHNLAITAGTTWTVTIVFDV